MANKRTLIIDGNNMTARFANAYVLTTSTGVLSGVVYGVLYFIRRFLKRKTPYQYHRVVFAFDSPQIVKFRKEMYPEYKAQRARQRKKRKSSEDFYYSYLVQTESLKLVLTKLNIIPMMLPGYEADDAVYKIIKSMPDEEFVIYSNDKDFHQMVSKRVVVAKPHHKLPKETFIDDKPKYFLISRALQGDASDNIKGVPQIGEKRAQQIVEEVGERKLIPFLQNIHKCSKYHEKLEEHKSIIRRNYRLMSLAYAYKTHTADVKGVYVRPRWSPSGYDEICSEFELRSMTFDGEIYEHLLNGLKNTLPKEYFDKIKKLPERGA